mmetsp:Transcript_80454/g.232431  ORF Transcript_80454/g.232431 Transcript_80454/m.232431 type:complete len:252 (+) Transcript_80454:539-1294(+)
MAPLRPRFRHRGLRGRGRARLRFRRSTQLPRRRLDWRLGRRLADLAGLRLWRFLAGRVGPVTHLVHVAAQTHECLEFRAAHLAHIRRACIRDFLRRRGPFDAQTRHDASHPLHALSPAPESSVGHLFLLGRRRRRSAAAEEGSDRNLPVFSSHRCWIFAQKLLDVFLTLVPGVVPNLPHSCSSHDYRLLVGLRDVEHDVLPPSRGEAADVARPQVVVGIRNRFRLTAASQIVKPRQEEGQASVRDGFVLVV